MRQGLEYLHNEWYTPVYLVEASRLTLGCIDLDPASSTLANRIVKAHTYYTKSENGLTQTWYGNVFLNPPYGKDEQGNGNIRQFVEKLLAEYQDGHIQQAILITTADTDAGWFQHLWKYPLCFLGHKAYFYIPMVSSNGNVRYKAVGQMFGTSISYIGHNVAAFCENFLPYGHIVLPPVASAIHHALERIV